MAKDKKNRTDETADNNQDLLEALEAQAAQIEELKAQLAAKSTTAPTESGETIQMIWPFKHLPPGTEERVFGRPGVANKLGLLVVDVPRERVKNEMKRKKSLVPLDVFMKKRQAEIEFAAQFED